MGSSCPLIPNMMKLKHYSTLFFLFICFICSAQIVPKLVNYQAIAFNVNGNPLNQESIDVKIAIIKGTSTNLLIYEEEHNLTTASNGLFSLQIGNGITTGNGIISQFGNLDWNADDFFMNVQINIGNGYEDLGTQQLVSVPFAFRANRAEFVTNPGTFIIAGNNITINGNGLSSNPFEISSSFTEIDGDNSNELITNFSLSNSGDLELSDAGGNYSISLPWRFDGNNIYSNTSGNVGIGTSIPATKLDVKTISTRYAGQFIQDFPSGSDKFGLYGLAKGLGNGENIGIQGEAINSTDNKAIVGRAFGGTNNWAGFFPLGNVHVAEQLAIGTTSPSEKLHILNGTIKIDDGLNPYKLPSSDGSANQYLKTDGSGNVTWVNIPTVSGPDGDWTISSSDIYTANSGNVGIGTNSPSAKLDLVGSFQYEDGNSGFGKILTSDGDGNAAWATNSTYTEFGNLNSNSSNHSTNWESTNCSFTFNKQYTDSKVEIHFNSRIYSGQFASTNGILFEIRVDGNSPDFDNHGSIRTTATNEFISIFAVFDSLPLGQHTVDLYAKTAPSGSSFGVTIDPGGWGGKIIVKETF